MWLALLLSLQLCVSVLALDAVSTTIETAQGLALKKNRKDACETLTRALADTGVAAKSSRLKLTEALAQIAKVFFTDKGQRAFEAGQSLMFENPDMAMSQFKEALALEDDNITVLVAMAKVQVAKSECDAALATLQKARQLNPFYSEAALLELRTLLCLKNTEAYLEKVKALPPLDKAEDAYLQSLQAQSLMGTTPKKAFDILLRLVDGPSKFPENYFYLARASKDLEKENEPWLQKYVSLCKAVTSKERKQFSLEPRLCSHQKEAQDELAKKSTDL